MNNAHKEIFNKIEGLKRKLNKVSNQIEKERFESNEDDTVILQELLDKKDMIEQQIAEQQEVLILANQGKTTTRTFHLEINGGQKKITIVSANEVDPGNGQISSKSPLAKALLGRKKGDHITIETPAGTQSIKIRKVE